jgi:phytoene dehydrogenase-like protein
VNDRPGQRADVAVIGAGFGGLAAALRLSERGAKVVVVEALSYPGGCASTFRRQGYAFEAGATLSSGFGPGQLFRGWIDRYRLDVETEEIDPLVELRSPLGRLPIPAERDALVASFLEGPEAPVDELSRFFERQRRVADLLWTIMDRSELLPPLGRRALIEHARRAGEYLRIAPLVGKTLGSVLRQHRLEGYRPLRVYLDALCQITVQCPASEAEALFAMAAMDYYFRGTAHVRGGLGSLAWALVRAIRDLGGEVLFANAATRIFRESDGWHIRARQGEIVVPKVVANLLPQDLRRLAGLRAGELPDLDRLALRVEEGWGAAMLYRVVRAPENAPPRAAHLALVRDAEAPFLEGNHVFCSVSSADDVGRAPAGHRTVTASTHLRPAVIAAGTPEEKARYVGRVQGRMRETLGALAPEWQEHVELEMTASPRTFERFTGRFLGLVGGIPRRAGLHNYRNFEPKALLPGLHLVGDTRFPGQSTLAAALGGVKVADAIAAWGIADRRRGRKAAPALALRLARTRDSSGEFP